MIAPTGPDDVTDRDELVTLRRWLHQRPRTGPFTAYQEPVSRTMRTRMLAIVEGTAAVHGATGPTAPP